MRILFITGNGFDINLGMKTRYSDFYNYYQSTESENDLIRKLKESISKEIETWADLELSLGKYTENLNAQNEFDAVFEDIGEKLADYLEEEESKIDFSKIDEAKLFDYLSYPERSLLKADTEKVLSFKNKWSSYQWTIDIMTLNYTQTIEKLLREKFKNVKIGTHSASPIILRSVYHIHGYVKERMIMGVNDITQVANKTFHDNQDVLEALIKTTCNKAQKHMIDDLCTNLISSANLICIFGSSIGDTDNHWWELIGQQLKRDCQLIIFSRGEEIKERIVYKKARLEREMKNLFLGKTKLSEEEKDKVRDKVFVGINTNMFSNIVGT